MSLAFHMTEKHLISISMCLALNEQHCCRRCRQHCHSLSPAVYNSVKWKFHCLQITNMNYYTLLSIYLFHLNDSLPPFYFPTTSNKNPKIFSSDNLFRCSKKKKIATETKRWCIRTSAYALAHSPFKRTLSHNTSKRETTPQRIKNSVFVVHQCHLLNA